MKDVEKNGNVEKLTLKKLEAIENQINENKKKGQKQPNSNNKKGKGVKNNNSIIDTPIKANQVISDEEIEELKKKQTKSKEKKKKKTKESKTEEQNIDNKTIEIEKAKTAVSENENSNTEKKEENQEIEGEKLDAISKELRLIKIENEKRKHPILIKVFTNIVIAIVFVLYIYLIMMLPQIIGKENFILSLKIASLVLAFISVVLLEIGFNKKKSGCTFHSIEFFVIAGYSLTLSIFVEFESELTKTFQIVFVCLILVYFLIKSIIDAKESIKNIKLK